MDYSESTKVVFQRIEQHDPENVSKIMGYLLLKGGFGEQEMIRLALAPESVIQSLINIVRQQLMIITTPMISKPPNNNNYLPTNFTNSPNFTPSSSGSSPWSAHHINPQPAAAPINICHHHQQQLMMLDHHQFHHQPPQPLLQICDSFRQGYCKYGGACRLLHVLPMENGSFMVLNPPNSDDIADLHHVMSHNVSLKHLKMDLIQLLKSRRGIPVSISSLPILYYDKFERPLQVETYLLQAQCSLPQLLAHLTKCIRVIDRPHGRQSIILADDVHRYKRFIKEKSDQDELSGTNSRQVYMTFAPESMFTDEDVRDYFDKFGSVREVRIPNVDKRMYGFVTFAYPETAALVLTKTNPHFIFGTPVLVKPYRLRPMLVDRKKTKEKDEHPINNAAHPDLESKPPSTANEKQLVGEKDQSADLESKHITDGSTLPQDQSELELNGEKGTMSNCSSSKGKVDNVDETCNNGESGEEVNLPDSPFGYEVADF